ncbi:hypothetical protein A3Q56_05658 [Intoshia linei]|uniref:Metallothionein n=1 Tax=Intoshia linei TaxID=1819745 RepID=A0A177AZK2_9BILA|nr:hypothetical protein A3Q56_05658 [Intoshia linei]
MSENTQTDNVTKPYCGEKKNCCDKCECTPEKCCNEKCCCSNDKCACCQN